MRTLTVEPSIFRLCIKVRISDAFLKCRAGKMGILSIDCLFLHSVFSIFNRRIIHNDFKNAIRFLAFVASKRVIKIKYWTRRIMSNQHIDLMAYIIHR